MPGPLEIILLVAVVVVPLAILFAVVYFAVKLATKNKGRSEPPPR